MDNYNKQTDVVMEGAERWRKKSFPIFPIFGLWEFSRSFSAREDFTLNFFDLI